MNFSDNTRLKLMDVFDNQLTRVDLSMLKDLEFAYLDHNFLTELDLSQNASLDPVHGGFTAQNNFLNTITLPVRADLLVAPRFYSEQNPKPDMSVWNGMKTPNIPVRSKGAYRLPAKPSMQSGSRMTM